VTQALAPTPAAAEPSRAALRTPAAGGGAPGFDGMLREQLAAPPGKADAAAAQPPAGDPASLPGEERRAAAPEAAAPDAEMAEAAEPGAGVPGTAVPGAGALPPRTPALPGQGGLALPAPAGGPAPAGPVAESTPAAAPLPAPPQAPGTPPPGAAGAGTPLQRSSVARSGQEPRPGPAGAGATAPAAPAIAASRAAPAPAAGLAPELRPEAFSETLSALAGEPAPATRAGAASPAGAAAASPAGAMVPGPLPLPPAAPPLAQALPGLDTPLADPDWGAAIGARLVWAAARGVQGASIALNPPELGPLTLSLAVNEDEASVSFVSSHAAVRDAIEAALPRLRELFASEGMVLGEVDVSAGDGRAGSGRDGDGGRSPGARTGAGARQEIPAPGAARHGDGLVDTFA